MLIKRKGTAKESQSSKRSIANGTFSWGTTRSLRTPSLLVLLWMSLGIASCILVGIKKTQAESGVLGTRPVTLQQKTSVNTVNSSADTGSDPGRSSKPQEGDRKIENLASEGLSKDIKQCQSLLADSKRNKTIDSNSANQILAIQNITACVRLLISQVDDIERTIKKVKSSTSSTTFGTCPQKTTAQDQDQEHAINDLTKCAEELLKHTWQLSKDSLWSSLVGCSRVLLYSAITYMLITYFMKEHYEPCVRRLGNIKCASRHDILGDARTLARLFNNRGPCNSRENVYSGVASLLANAAEQISQEERHYSNLRFTLFTIFMAINGALGALYLNKEYVESTQSIHTMLPIVGLLLTIVFASLEFAIDWIETEYSYMGRAVWLYWRQSGNIQRNPNSLSVGGASLPINWVRGPIWGIFFLAALIWIDVPKAPLLSPLALDLVATVVTIGFWFFLIRAGSSFARGTIENLNEGVGRRS